MKIRARTGIAQTDTDDTQRIKDNNKMYDKERGITGR